jgi:SAM-dependent methyltransferase
METLHELRGPEIRMDWEFRKVSENAPRHRGIHLLLSFPLFDFRFLMSLHSVLEFAHTVVSTTLQSGDVAVDATVGNGHDTLALVQEVGLDGQVYGFDVQQEAIEETQRHLDKHKCGEQVELLHAGHEDMEQHLPADVQGEAGAVMFNLGYLPGSSSELTTTPSTTLPALRSTLRLLRPGGVVTVVLYTGHEGGAEEAQAVDAWAADLPQDRYRALSYRFVNQKNDPPRLVVVEKRDSTADEPVRG